MYICEKHGEIDSEWCDDCMKTTGKCDHRERTGWSWSSLFYGMNIDRCTDITMEYCDFCGEIFRVNAK